MAMKKWMPGDVIPYDPNSFQASTCMCFGYVGQQFINYHVKDIFLWSIWGISTDLYLLSQPL